MKVAHSLSSDNFGSFHSTAQSKTLTNFVAVCHANKFLATILLKFVKADHIETLGFVLMEPFFLKLNKNESQN